MRVVAADSGVTADLLGVCVRSALDAVAVGRGGVIVRWDGARWARESSPTDDMHYLIVFSRLRGRRTPELTKQVAATVLDLDRKLEHRQLSKPKI